MSPEIRYKDKIVSYWTGPVAALPQLKEKTDGKTNEKLTILF